MAQRSSTGPRICHSTESAIIGRDRLRLERRARGRLLRREALRDLTAALSLLLACNGLVGERRRALHLSLALGGLRLHLRNALSLRRLLGALGRRTLRRRLFSGGLALFSAAACAAARIAAASRFATAAFSARSAAARLAAACFSAAARVAAARFSAAAAFASTAGFFGATILFGGGDLLGNGLLRNGGSRLLCSQRLLRSQRLLCRGLLCHRLFGRRRRLHNAFLRLGNRCLCIGRLRRERPPPKSIAGEEAAGNTRGESIDAGDAKAVAQRQWQRGERQASPSFGFARAWSE